MPTLQQLETALDLADRAGDTEAAAMFAADIRNRRYEGATPLPTPGSEIRQRIAETTTPLEAGLSAAGRSLEGLVRGGQDLAARVMGDEAQVEAIRQQMTRPDPMSQAIAQEQPGASLAGTVAPMAGAMLVPGAQGAVPSMVAGGLLSGLQYQEEPEQRLPAAAMGAALSGAGYGVGRMLAGPAARMDVEHRALAERGRQLGFQLFPGQRAGSRTLQQVDEALAAKPYSSAPYVRILENNQTRLNQIAAQAIGLPKSTKLITPERLGQADDAIGDQFRRSLSGQTVKLDDRFLKDLGDAEAQYRSAWGKRGGLTRVVDDALDEAADNNGVISAERFHQLQSMLREQGASAIKGRKSDSLLGKAIFSVRDALYDAAERSMTGDALDEFRDAQAKWKAFRALDNALTAQGDVSGLNLARALNREDVSGYRQGRTQTDLYDAARFFNTFRTPFGGSPTATRQSLTHLIGQAGVGGTGGGLLGAYMGADPLESMALGAMAPFAMRAAMRPYVRGLLPMPQMVQEALPGLLGGAAAGTTQR